MSKPLQRNVFLSHTHVGDELARIAEKTTATKISVYCCRTLLAFASSSVISVFHCGHVSTSVFSAKSRRGQGTHCSGRPVTPSQSQQQICVGAFRIVCSYR
ncbi:hypothetical protein CHARACLAT_031260 [Characodon lateralis]|uniref:Uncharacterized protein n=1 Tax=Characodon lateralis TaxID=208331 RepID=A0ABU7DBJ8_9TELE|nr:hypothetical protein [Characodon lateralis]